MFSNVVAQAVVCTVCCAFVGDKNFSVIKMYGATIKNKKVYKQFLLLNGF
jgi:hypothetical protein